MTARYQIPNVRDYSHEWFAIAGVLEEIEMVKSHAHSSAHMRRIARWPEKFAEAHPEVAKHMSHVDSIVAYENMKLVESDVRLQNAYRRLVRFRNVESED